MQVVRSGDANVRSDQVRLSPLPQALPAASFLAEVRSEGLPSKTEHAPEGVVAGGFPMLDRMLRRVLTGRRGPRVVAVLLCAYVAGCEAQSLSPNLTLGHLGPMANRSQPGWRATSGTILPAPSAKSDAAALEPLVSTGTGDFIGKAQPFEITRTAAGQDGVMLNLLNAPIGQAAKTVLGDILKVNYTLSDKITGTVTVQTTAPVPREALIDVFESTLKANGAIIVRGDGFYRIVPSANLGQSGTPLGRDAQHAGLGVQVRVVPLRHISASEAKKLIDPVGAPGAVLRADDQRNIVVVSGTQRELNEISSLLAVFDVDWLKGMSFALFPLKTSDPEAVANELEVVFGLDKDGPLKGTLRFVPNKRLSALLVITTRAAHIDTVRGWIAKLDQLAQSNEEQLFVYKVQNRSATELAAMLSRVLSRQRGAETQRGSETMPPSDIAPRYEPTTIASSAAASAALGPTAAGPTRTASRVGPGTGMATPSESLASGGRHHVPSGNRPAPPNLQPNDNKVVADEGNNALLIMASAQEYPRMLSILGRLDVLPTQVMLEAMIAEVTLNDELKFGIKWFFEKNNSKFILSDAVGGAVASNFPGFSYFFAAGNVKVALDAVSSITNVNVVSAPSLMVLDNRKAVLQVGDQVPIITQTAQNVITPGGPLINSVAFRDTGVILAVTPRVNDAGRVVLEIEQEVSNVAATRSAGIDSPTIQQRLIKTTVAVADGEVLALGGLIQERDNTSKTQVPILGNLPLLGSAFRQKTDKIDRTELLIFIRPLVVRDGAEARAVTGEFQKRLNLQAPASQKGKSSYKRDLGRIVR